MILTIVRLEAPEEPVLILDQNESGMQVVGGDPKMAETLGLSRFKDLKEISDYINSAGSGYQAHFDEESMNQDGRQEAEAGPEMDDRIAPALKTLKELMSRVQDRQAQSKANEEAKKPEAEMLQNPNIESLSPGLGHIYVSLDGDNIGNSVARAEAEDDEKTLSEQSARINAGQDVLRNWAQMMGGKVIEAGGDEGLVKVPVAAKAHIEELREQYRNVVGQTATVGVGKKISESTKARMLGKLTGKNKTVVFDETTEKELSLRTKDDSQNEAKKIRTAMSPNSAADPESQDQEQTDEADGVDPGVVSNESTESGTNAPPSDQSAAAPEEKPSEEQPEEEQPETAQLSPETVQAASDMPADDGKPKGSALDDRDHDKSIEDADYSESENPQMSKRMRYMAKYGKGN